MIHQIKLGSPVVHGAFSPDRPPVLRVRSGDVIESQTLDAGWGIEAPHPDGYPRQRYPRPPAPGGEGHALIGPIWIEDAEPGKTLIVHIEQLVPGPYGFTYAGGFQHRIHTALGLAGESEELMLWRLNAEAGVGTNQFGHEVQLRPFLGILGMPSPKSGYHDTASPRAWGGNIDCRDLVAGTRLYLPVPVPGGLFSFGDGHAAQGHGEVSVQAIECPMAHVRLRLEVDSTHAIDTPMAWTPQGWLTFGFADSLEAASMLALNAMLSLMLRQYKLSSRKQALALATAIVDLEITQIANPVVGVHARLPHDAVQMPAIPQH